MASTLGGSYVDLTCSGQSGHSTNVLSHHVTINEPLDSYYQNKTIIQSQLPYTFHNEHHHKHTALEYNMQILKTSHCYTEMEMTMDRINA